MADWDAEDLAGLPQVGELLAGRYRIERVLGVGGMGVVVEATHTGLGEKVAIKFLNRADASDHERMTRFTREAWAAAKIKSEHVARVTDVAQNDDGTAYLVMEYLEGHDLDAQIQRGPVPPQTAVDYVLQAAEALAEAHALGIVHRDLKPANLFLTHRADGSACIKVLDFGISKFTRVGAMTKTSSIMGSPLYMSPEQILSSKHVDARVDLWALGVILYELVAGTPPFSGDTLPQLMEEVLNARARPLREAAPHASPALESAIMRSMSQTIDDRYEDLAAFARAIGEHGSAAASGSVRFICGVLGALDGDGTLQHPADSAPAATPTRVSVGNPAESGTAPTVAAEGAPPAPSESALAARPTATDDARPADRATLVAALAGAAVTAVVLLVVGLLWLTGDSPSTTDQAAAVSSSAQAATTPSGAGRAPVDTGSAEADPPAPFTSAAPVAPASSTPSDRAASAPSASQTAGAAPPRETMPPPGRKAKRWNPYSVR
ncbi:MAG: protein kinase [Deltaproteobacteria bacterium]|jgi:serine/threonine-protein kinase|nr:protein kinase [Deltaproteobacteria bacterium]MBW2530741.1 protein kinase [Deltaproteobacteria bacterium]